MYNVDYVDGVFYLLAKASVVPPLSPLISSSIWPPRKQSWLHPCNHYQALHLHMIVSPGRFIHFIHQLRQPGSSVEQPPCHPICTISLLFLLGMLVGMIGHLAKPPIGGYQQIWAQICAPATNSLKGVPSYPLIVVIVSAQNQRQLPVGVNKKSSQDAHTPSFRWTSYSYWCWFWNLTPRGKLSYIKLISEHGPCVLTLHRSSWYQHRTRVEGVDVLNFSNARNVYCRQTSLQSDGKY